MGTQFKRSLSVLAQGERSVVDLATLRIRFDVVKSETQSPNQSEVTIYNLARDRSAKLGSEFSTVSINAGYEDHNGLIFTGEIVKVQRGREGNTETYAKLTLADGDSAYNRVVVNTTLRAGTGKADHAKAGIAALKNKGAVKSATRDPLASGEIQRPRARVVVGLARDVLRNAAANQNAAWSIQDGEVVWLPLQSTLGRMVILSPTTGIIGRVEEVDQGVKVKCLLQPLVRIGAPVELRGTNDAALGLGTDGQYRIVSLRHTGDSRGMEWYTEFIAARIGTQRKVSAGGAVA